MSSEIKTIRSSFEEDFDKKMNLYLKSDQDWEIIWSGYSDGQFWCILQLEHEEDPKKIGLKK